MINFLEFLIQNINLLSYPDLIKILLFIFGLITVFLIYKFLHGLVTNKINTMKYKNYKKYEKTLIELKKNKFL